MTVHYLNRALYYAPNQDQQNADFSWMYWTSKEPDPAGLEAPQAAIYFASYMVVRRGEMPEVSVASSTIVYTAPFPPQEILVPTGIASAPVVGTPDVAQPQAPNAITESADLTAWFQADDASFQGGSLQSWVKTDGTVADLGLVGIPTETTIDGQPAVHSFDSSNYLTGGALSTWIAADAWYVMVVFQPRADFTLNNISWWQNHDLIEDAGGYWGVYGYDSGGDKMYGYNYDATADRAVSGGITTNAVSILEYWKDGGNIVCRCNGLQGSTPSGDCQSLAASMYFGRGSNYAISQIVFYDALISSISRTNLRAYMKNKYPSLVI